MKKTKEETWRLAITNSEHNHPMAIDPFSFVQSQQGSEVASKQVKAEAEKLAEERKTAKTIKLRKDDVSQLIDDFLELGSPP